MSDLEKNSKSKPEAAWYVRTSDGGVYGAVDPATLRQWAEQGRIEPHDEISANRENWLKASEMEELEMDWTAEMDDNTQFGPFNFHLSHELVRRGVLKKDSTITNRRTGAIHNLIEDDIPEENAKDAEEAEQPQTTAKPQTDNTVNQTDSIKASTPQAASPHADLQAKTEKSKRAPRTDTPTAERLKAMQKNASEARKQLNDARKQLSKQRAANSAMQDNINRLQENLHTVTAERDACNEQLIELQDQLTEALANTENREAQFQQLQEHYKRLQQESNEQFETIDQLRAELMESEQHSHKIITAETERSTAKTAIMVKAMRTILKDGDIATGEVPENLLSDSETTQIQDLQSRLYALQDQLEGERTRTRQLEEKLITSSGKTGQNIILAILLAILVGVITNIFIQLAHSNSKREKPAIPFPSLSMTTNKPATSHSPSAQPRSAPPPRPTTKVAPPKTDGLDLPPDNTNPQPQHKTAAVDWPGIKLARAKTSHTRQGLKIVFHNGVFSEYTKLTPEAKLDLARLADQLRNHTSKFTLIIEGHTDSTPIRGRQTNHVTNYALALDRAETAKKYLIKNCHLPESFIRTVTAGEGDPPYPNTTPGSRSKNRTVVMTLTPRRG